MKCKLLTGITALSLLLTGCASSQVRNLPEASDESVAEQQDVVKEELSSTAADFPVGIAKNFEVTSAEDGGCKITFTNENNVVDEEYIVNKGTLAMSCALLRDTKTGETVRRYDPLSQMSGYDYNGHEILGAAMIFSADYIPDNGGIASNAFTLAGEFTLKGTISAVQTISGDIVDGEYWLILTDNGELPAASNVSDTFKVLITEGSELYEQAEKLAESGGELTIIATNPTVKMIAFTGSIDNTVSFESVEIA